VVAPPQTTLSRKVKRGRPGTFKPLKWHIWPSNAHDDEKSPPKKFTIGPEARMGAVG